MGKTQEHKPITTKRIARVSLSTQLYSTLRTALMDGQFQAGQRLTISNLAEEFGTSITPVREAIARLVSERALEMRAATSVQVPKLSAKDLQEIQMIRKDLEGTAAARTAERITPSQLDELKALNERFFAKAADPQEASILNRDFHFAILRFADMPILEGICENMWVLMGPFLRFFHDKMPVEDLSNGVHKHTDLLRALEARDPEASRRAIQEDIRWGEQMVATFEKELDESGNQNKQSSFLVGS